MEQKNKKHEIFLGDSIDKMSLTEIAIQTTSQNQNSQYN